MTTPEEMNSNLHCMYLKLLSISSAAVYEHSDETVIGVVEKRKTILDEIEKQSSEFKKQFPQKKMINPETRKLLPKLIEIDNLIKKKMQQRLFEIKNEIGGLYKSSRAAVAYSAYNKKR